MTDIFTICTHAVATRDQKASIVALFLIQQWFLHYGVPDIIHSDQGRNFKFDIIWQLCKIYDLQKSRTTAFHPEGNWSTERFNRTPHELPRTLLTLKKKLWPVNLLDATFACYVFPVLDTVLPIYSSVVNPKFQSNLLCCQQCQILSRIVKWLRIH